VVRQARATRPILPLRLFRSATLSGANSVQALMSASFLSFFFLASLDLERVLAYTPLALGLGFLPVALVMGSFSIRFTAPLVMRFGAFRVAVAGQLVIVLALLILALGPERADYVRNLLLPMILLGLGGGLCFPAVTMIGMSEARPEDSGLASGLINTTGQVGGALGLAILATAAAARSAALEAGGAARPEALTAGFDFAFALCAALFAVAIAITIFVIRDQPAAVAEDAAL